MTRPFKRLIAGLALMMAAGLALALPAPRDIEAAVAAGRYSEAETQLREVLREKPGSARAHYELGQVLAQQGRHDEARLELQAAQLIDPQLKFARDPQHFRDLLARIPAGGTRTQVAPAANGAAATPAGPAHAAATDGFSMLPLLVVGGLAALIVVAVLLFRAASARRREGFGAPPAYADNAYGSSWAPAPSRGPGLGGAVLGGLAGMAAGYGIARAMEHDNAGADHADHADTSRYAPVDTPADYGAFDSGTGGDAWDDGGGSGDDSNW